VCKHHAFQPRNASYCQRPIQHTMHSDQEHIHSSGWICDVTFYHLRTSSPYVCAFVVTGMYLRSISVPDRYTAILGLHLYMHISIFWWGTSCNRSGIPTLPYSAFWSYDLVKIYHCFGELIAAIRRLVESLLPNPYELKMAPAGSTRMLIIVCQRGWLHVGGHWIMICVHIPKNFSSWIVKSQFNIFHTLVLLLKNSEWVDYFHDFIIQGSTYVLTSVMICDLS
jgi:hypothetical protein